jgi:hypothetical protein
MSCQQSSERFTRSPLCPECTSILSTAWEAGISIPPGHPSWDTPVDPNTTFPWHATLAEAKNAANKGCHLCILIWRYGVRKEAIDYERPVKVVFKHADHDFGRWEFAVITARDDLNVLQLCIRGARDALWDGAGSPPAYGYSTDGESISDELVQMLKDWITTCETDHGNCALPTEVNLPSRLLEIGDSEEGHLKIRLVDALPEHRGRYITLSHCWGPNPELSGLTRTLRSNVDDYYKDLPMDLLSRTFQDAVTITKRLGAAHLWIDSLCIIQEDAKDWESESIKMADIYAYSLVTIAATGTQSSGDGLFLQRKEAEMTPLIWPTPEAGNMLAIHPFLLRDYFNYESIPQPIYGRAWCMQELTLSRRVLHFLPGQVIWNCATSTRHEFEECSAKARKSACLLQEIPTADLMVGGKVKPLPPTATFVETREGIPTAHGNRGHFESSAGLVENARGNATICFGHPQADGTFLGRLRQNFTASKEAYLTRTKKIIIGRPRPRTLHDEWLSLVENYSIKDITQTKDRLPAIWSFATRMQATVEDEYCCGLWRSDFPRGLVFMLYRPSMKGASKPNPTSPSWSWAAREGKIRYYGDGRLHSTKTVDPLGKTSLISLENADAKPMTMGRSSRAVLTLKCLVTPVTGVADEKEGFLLRCGALEMSLDHIEHHLTLAGVEILALHMMDYCCLLVVPAEPGSKEYRRVGLGYVRHQGEKSFKQVKDGYLQLPWREDIVQMI